MKVALMILTISVIGIGVPKHYISTNNISVGDTFTYAIELPSDIVASLAPTFNGFEIIESLIDRRPTSTVHQFKLQVFSLESQMIPSVALTEINGLEPTILAPIYFNLVSLLTPTSNQLNDISPVYEIWYVNGYLLTILLSILVIAGMAYIAWKKKRQRNQIVMKQKPVPPIDVALDKINELKRQLTADPRVIKAGYFRLTEIFCTYLTNQTKINVLDATTVEMSRLLKSSKDLPLDVIEMILSIAKRMDHYKFSQSPELTMPNIDRTINQIIELIKRVEK